MEQADLVKQMCTLPLSM